jgi:hypothetical protein
MYAVYLWGSEPHTNDDCASGREFEELQEAKEAFSNPEMYFHPNCLIGVRWVELDSTEDIYEVRKISSPREEAENNGEDEWRREMAMEAGMLHGCQAYNEVMGFEVEV